VRDYGLVLCVLVDVRNAEPRQTGSVAVDIKRACMDIKPTEQSSSDGRVKFTADARSMPNRPDGSCSLSRLRGYVRRRPRRRRRCTTMSPTVSTSNHGTTSAMRGRNERNRSVGGVRPSQTEVQQQRRLHLRLDHARIPTRQCSGRMRRLRAVSIRALWTRGTD